MNPSLSGFDVLLAFLEANSKSVILESDSWMTLILMGFKEPNDHNHKFSDGVSFI